MDPQYPFSSTGNATDDEDDIHTIHSFNYQSPHDRSSIGSSSGLMQASSESFRVRTDGIATRGIPVLSQQEVPPQQRPMRWNQDSANLPNSSRPTTQTSSPNVIGPNHPHVMEEEGDASTTTTTLEYPMSMDSFYSHRDVLSATGSYGADMSFVTTQTSSTGVASPPPPLPVSPSQHGQSTSLEPQLPAPPPPMLEQALPRLQLHEVGDGEVVHELPQTSPECFNRRSESTHSAIKAAMERGTNMAYDESSSVIGLSTVEHTIASSSFMTKDNHQYLFHSNFLKSHNSAAADVINVEEDHRPVDLPHPPSLPYKGTDLTTESMFLGMEYDNDYIKTKLKEDAMKADGIIVAKSNDEIEESIRRVQRKRILCCVYSLILLISIVVVGGVLCTFGTTCPGLEKLSSRSTTSAATEDNKDGTFVPVPSPTSRIQNTDIPTTTFSEADSSIAPTLISPPTDRPVVLQTNPPTMRPMVLVVPPPMVVVKESRSPTTSPVAPPNENDTSNEPDNGSPTNEINTDNEEENTPTRNAPNNSNDNEPQNEPTTSPVKEPNNEVKEDGNDTPIPTDTPTILSPSDNGPTGNQNDDTDESDDDNGTNEIEDDTDDTNEIEDDSNTNVPTISPAISPTFMDDLNDDASNQNDGNDDGSSSGRNP